MILRFFSSSLALVVALSCAGCLSDDSSLRLAARGMGLGNYSAAQYPRTRPEIEAFTYAQLGVRLPKYPPSIFVLTALDQGAETWSSADGVAIHMDYGQVVELSGLSPGFKATRSSTPLSRALEAGQMPQSGSSYPVAVATTGVKSSQSFALICNLTEVGGATEIEIVDLTLSVRPFTEVCSDGQSTVRNEYWISTKRPYVWRSRQEVAPGLPSIQLDVLKRPG